MGTQTVQRGWVLTSGPPEPSANTDVAMPLVIRCGFGCTWWPAPAGSPCEPWLPLSLLPEPFDGVECSEWVLEGIWVSDMLPSSPLPSKSLSRSTGNGAGPPPWAPALCYDFIPILTIYRHTPLFPFKPSMSPWHHYDIITPLWPHFTYLWHHYSIMTSFLEHYKYLSIEP